jgi:tetratricopeptide (TPR) repeat protein
MSVARLIAPLIFAGALIAMCLPAHAQQPPTDFAIENKDARAAFERGMIAVKLRAWEEAIDGFLETWDKEEKPNPIVYFNLGLALEKANQPLLAATCFQTYLTLFPKAANANEVRNEIATLEKLSAEKLVAIFKSMESRAAALKKDSESSTSQNDAKIKTYINAYERIATSYAASGKMDDALATEKLIKERDPSKPDTRPTLWVVYAERLLNTGDVKKAKDILAMVEKTFPIPPNYEADLKLRPADKENYTSRKLLLGGMRDNYDFGRPEQEPAWKTDAWHILESVLDRYANYRAARRKDPSNVIKTTRTPKSHRYAEFDLEGAARLVAEELNKFASNQDLSKVYISFHWDPAIILTGAISFEYGSLGLKYQYIKQEFSNGALPPKSGAGEPTKKERLLKGKGWIGIGVTSPSYKQVTDNSISVIKPVLRRSDSFVGVYVLFVEDESPAKLAGIMKDDLIKMIDDKGVTDFRDFIRHIRDTPVGKNIKLVIIRNGNEEKRTLAVARRPD